MVARRSTLACALLAMCALVAMPGVANAHPLHTTMTELSYDPASRVLTATLRVFADDFSAAVTGRRADGSVVVPPDSAIVRYVSARLAVMGPVEGRVSMRWCGMRRDGVVLFLCLRGTLREQSAGVTMKNALMTEVFGDQVNIVQTNLDGRRRTLLFTSRDGVKPLS
ncbi:MAG: DUF6702 family protein [Gemmatimonadaceae bacterium]